MSMRIRLKVSTNIELHHICACGKQKLAAEGSYVPKPLSQGPQLQERLMKSCMHPELNVTGCYRCSAEAHVMFLTMNRVDGLYFGF